MRIHICAACRAQSSAITGLPLLALLLYSRPLCRFITLTSIGAELIPTSSPMSGIRSNSSLPMYADRSSNGYISPSSGRPSTSEPNNSKITWLAYISPPTALHSLSHCTSRLTGIGSQASY
ncbi:hypothetical protein BDW60DRAFT_28455 [Aspergillus nidulans var. acristatus]